MSEQDGRSIVVPTASSILLPDRPAAVMGILNVTPDSFSDGGRYLDPEAAIEHGLALFDEGADVVDVGGESSRPGADPVPEAEELRRVVPVVAALAASGKGRVSVDTVKPDVARAAIEAGATLVNDISASLHEVVASVGRPDVGWVAMHMQGDPRTMQVAPSYGDVVDEVVSFLAGRADAARAAGVAEVWLDPGIGFGKTEAHNASLLRHLDRLVALGFPVVVGTSRKRFLGAMLARSDAGRRGGAPSSGSDDAGLEPVPTEDRLAGSVATEVWAVAMGARMVRAHDVAAAVQACRVAWTGPRG